MRPFVRRIRARLLSPRIRAQEEFYRRFENTAAARDWQLMRLNELWRTLSNSLPYFRALKHDHLLPEVFASVEEFSARVPMMTRHTVQSSMECLRDPSRRIDGWRFTGGSTDEPLRIPIWRSEPRIAADDIWYARRWLDVSPSDKLFLIWGHSHILGGGLGGTFNGWYRACKDRFLGYLRFPAYRLDEADLHRAGEAMVRFQPSYVVGYSAALDGFVRANKERRGDFRRLDLKVVIATAESFPLADSRSRISEFFGCPVVMEYGAVETGPIAHQRPDGTYSVFWRHYFVEAQAYDGCAGTREILVTALFPRCLPLIRYRIGDLIAVPSASLNPVQTFSAVAGRCSDTVSLPDGTTLHAVAISHAVNQSPIRSFQVVRSSTAAITLRYTSPAPLRECELSPIRVRLARIAPGLASIPLVRVESLEQTVAGKTLQVLRTSCAAESPVDVAPLPISYGSGDHLVEGRRL